MGLMICCQYPVPEGEEDVFWQREDASIERDTPTGMFTEYLTRGISVEILERLPFEGAGKNMKALTKRLEYWRKAIQELDDE